MVIYPRKNSSTIRGIIVSVLYTVIVLSFSCGNPDSPAPSGLTAPTGVYTTAGDGHVSISWGTVSGATSYYIYFTVGSDVTKLEANRIAVAGTTYNVTGLLNSTQYAFAISAINGSSESGLSEIVLATPKTISATLAAPTGLRATVGNSIIILAWGNVGEATSYKVYWAAGSTVTFAGKCSTTVLTTITIRGLSNNTQYAFAVASGNASGQSDLSSVIIAVPVPDTGSAGSAVIVFDDIYCAYDSVSSTYKDRITPTRSDSLPFNIVLKNTGGANALSVQCSLSTPDLYIKLTQPIGAYNNISKQASVTNIFRYRMNVARTIPPAHPIPIILHIKDSWGGYWIDSCSYVPNPLMIDTQIVDDDSVPDSKGNGDHHLQSGETVEYTPRLQNNTSATISGIAGLLYSTFSDITIRSNNRKHSYPDIGPSARFLPDSDFVFDISSSVNLNYDSVRFDLLVYGNSNGKRRTWVCPVIMPANCLAPAITLQLSSQNVTSPATATFSVIATGTALTYQWQRANPATPTVFANVMTGSIGKLASYNTAPTSVANDNRSCYRCIVTNGCGSDTSTIALLSVVAYIAPIITLQPTPQNVEAPATATFSVVATGTALTYQWQRAEPATPTIFANVTTGGSTYSSYSFPMTSVVKDSGARYRCIVTNNIGSDTSIGVTLVVRCKSAFITSLAWKDTVTAPGTVKFTVAATGTSLTYQWQRAAPPAPTVFANVTTGSAGNSASYYSAPTSVANDNRSCYRCIVTNGCGSDTSSIMTLKVK
jgi:hypothetical protein